MEEALLLVSFFSDPDFFKAISFQMTYNFLTTSSFKKKKCCLSEDLGENLSFRALMNILPKDNLYCLNEFSYYYKNGTNEYVMAMHN